jgi:hypothetical protein
MLLENFEGLVCIAWEVFYMLIDEYEMLYTEYV